MKPLLDCNTSIKLNLKIANISTSTLSWRNSLSILYLEEIETRQPYFGFGFKGLNMTGRKTKTRKQSFFRFWKWIVSEWCNWFFSCSVQPKTLSFKCVLIENGNKGFFEVKIRHKTLKSFAWVFFLSKANRINGSWHDQMWMIFKCLGFFTCGRLVNW